MLEMNLSDKDEHFEGASLKKIKRSPSRKKKSSNPLRFGSRVENEAMRNTNYGTILGQNPENRKLMQEIHTVINLMTIDKNQLIENMKATNSRVQALSRSLEVLRNLVSKNIQTSGRKIVRPRPQQQFLSSNCQQTLEKAGPLSFANRISIVSSGHLLEGSQSLPLPSRAANCQEASTKSIAISDDYESASSDSGSEAPTESPIRISVSTSGTRSSSSIITSDNLRILQTGIQCVSIKKETSKSSLNLSRGNVRENKSSGIKPLVQIKTKRVDSTPKRSTVTHISKEEFFCTICSKEFISARLLKKHELEHCETSSPNPDSDCSDPEMDVGDVDPKHSLSCYVCDEKFHVIKDLNRHVREVHIIDEDHQTMSFKSSNQFSYDSLKNPNVKGTNMKAEGEDDPPIIIERDKSSINEHKEVKLGSAARLQLNMFKCFKCNKVFTTKYYFKIHSLVHQEGKKFECQICNKKFMAKQSFNLHQRIHTGENLFECQVCSKKLPTKNKLVIHSRTHTGEKPFKCALCDRGFTRKDHLDRHYLIHTGERPFECLICYRRFAQGSHLKLHHQKMHSDDKSE